jgi:hypothetical protein
MALLVESVIWHLKTGNQKLCDFSFRFGMKIKALNLIAAITILPFEKKISMCDILHVVFYSSLWNKPRGVISEFPLSCSHQWQPFDRYRCAKAE